MYLKFQQKIWNSLLKLESDPVDPGPMETLIILQVLRKWYSCPESMGFLSLLIIAIILPFVAERELIELYQFRCTKKWVILLKCPTLVVCPTKHVVLILRPYGFGHCFGRLWGKGRWIVNPCELCRSKGDKACANLSGYPGPSMQTIQPGFPLCWLSAVSTYRSVILSSNMLSASFG